ncbi:acyl-CoA dehydrogenase family protein [Thioalkalivibrio sp. XN279]|uniref:acyl-CoA dehydrogenase family protein n=1 Tax=Thioalkalivibrio sp. XN279 TaxID=2714953 RepID=UPI00140A7799|nr:acyl-CoA dehydrogenase family protein [Thioalkalivibrio sp. XN279]NHA13450.1 acyl-CoA dehydrogenase [Thioalkalivibrio sp. XN279]
MDFSFTEEQLMIQEAARDFAQREIVPIAAEFDISGKFPEETLRKAGELGFMGVEVPEEYGGSALDAVGFALMMEEIAAADAAHSTIISVHNSLYCNGILQYGTEEQKQKYVTPVASGEVFAAYALTEPQSGSDAANMRTRAVRDGDHYVINGKKSWITSGPVARYILLFAMTDPAAGPKGVSAFMIDTEKDGFHRGKIEPKLGIRASATCEIELADYRCPVEDRIANEGDGFKIAMSILDAGRIGIAAQAVGIARAAYEASLQYVRERHAFGTPIGSFQMIQAKVADMKMRLEAARLLTLKAAWNKKVAAAAGLRNTTESSCAKLFASEAAMFITHAAVQIHGGMGYSKEMPIERYFRDAKITEIYEGTSEIQRMVIARQETGLR